ncbi:hypothetical protein ACVRWZ_11640, partial [Streptococcus pneumoniae]
MVITRTEIVANKAARLIEILLNSGIICAKTNASIAISITGIKILFFNLLDSIDLFGNCKKCYTIFMETVYDKAQKLNSKNFKLLIGVKKETF